MLNKLLTTLALITLVFPALVYAQPEEEEEPVQTRPNPMKSHGAKGTAEGAPQLKMRRPEAGSQMKRPEGASQIMRPEGAPQMRPEGASQTLRPEGASQIMRPEGASQMRPEGAPQLEQGTIQQQIQQQGGQ